MTSFHLKYLPTGLSPNTVTLGVRASAYEVQGHTTVRSSEALGAAFGARWQSLPGPLPTGPALRCVPCCGFPLSLSPSDALAHVHLSPVLCALWDDTSPSEVAELSGACSQCLMEVLASTSLSLSVSPFRPCIWCILERKAFPL